MRDGQGERNPASESASPQPEESIADIADEVTDDPKAPARGNDLVEDPAEDADGGARDDPDQDGPEPKPVSARAARAGRADDGAGRRATGVSHGRSSRHRRAPAQSGFVRGAKIGARVLVALLAVVVLTGTGFVWHTLRVVVDNAPHGSAVPVPPAPTVAASGTTPPKPVNGKEQTILLLGNDSRDGATPAELAALGTGDDGGSMATDTIMVLHVPANGKRAALISFPRDSWVNIPGYGMSKINSAYADGYVDAMNKGGTAKDARSAGILLLIQTLDELTGLRINHYAMVNLLGFYEISEAIGPVRVCLNQAMGPSKVYGATGVGLDAGWEGDQYAYNYSGINLRAGWNSIVGKQALAFVRQRHGLPNGDLDRIKRQQYFLSAVLDKLTSAGMLLNPMKFSSVLSTISKTLFTDPDLDLIKFVAQVQDIATGNIAFGTIPNSFGTSPGGLSIENVDPDEVRAYIEKLTGESTDSKLAKAKAAPPAQVSVIVLNESDKDGVATANAAALQKIGMNATVGDAYEQSAQTIIKYPDGSQGQAKTVGRYVPGARLVLSSEVSTVTLILGADGLQARSLRAKATSAPVSSSAAGSGASGTDGAGSAPGSGAATGSPSVTFTGDGTVDQNAKSCIN
ncbi:MAG: LCP family protein [Actinomycetia bacterium]|nr:LCP family protein [Actinomycetes bacterium]